MDALTPATPCGWPIATAVGPRGCLRPTTGPPAGRIVWRCEEHAALAEAPVVAGAGA